MLTRLGIYNIVITIVGKELFENETDNSTTFFLISNILFKIVVNDLLNNQNITSSTYFIFSKWLLPRKWQKSKIF